MLVQGWPKKATHLLHLLAVSEYPRFTQSQLPAWGGYSTARPVFAFLEKKHTSIHLRHTGPSSSAFKIGSNEHLSHQHAPLIKLRNKKKNSLTKESRAQTRAFSWEHSQCFSCVRHSQRTVLNAVIGINFPTSHCEDLWWILPAAS